MSVRCYKCGLFNSFTFNTNQKRCIKCNSLLDQESVLASEIYREDLLRGSFKQNWNNTEDTFIITNNKF